MRYILDTEGMVLKYNTRFGEKIMRLTEAEARIIGCMSGGYFVSNYDFLAYSDCWLNYYIRMLRKKGLKIKTVRGIGYKLEDEILIN